MFRLTLEPSTGINVSTQLKLHLWFGGVVQANVVIIIAVYTGFLCACSVPCRKRQSLPTRYTSRTHNRPVYTTIILTTFAWTTAPNHKCNFSQVLILLPEDGSSVSRNMSEGFFTILMYFYNHTFYTSECISLLIQWLLIQLTTKFHSKPV